MVWVIFACACHAEREVTYNHFDFSAFLRGFFVFVAVFVSVLIFSLHLSTCP